MPMLEQGGAHPVVVELDDHAVHVHVEQPGGVVGPLQVPAHPVEGFGDAAQHEGTSPSSVVGVGSAAASGDCCCWSCCWWWRSWSSAGPNCSGTGGRRAVGGLLGHGHGHVEAERGVVVGQHPRVLGTAALAGVHHQAALGQRHPGQAAGQDPDLLAVVDGEGAQVEVAGPEPSVDQRRAGGEGDDGLGDVAARVGDDVGPAVGQLLVRRVRPEDQAVAAGGVDGLDHHLVDAVEHELAHVVLAEAVGLHVAQQRRLAQVVLDEVGHVAVDELVVGHPVAHRVGDGEVAGAGRVDEPRAAQHGVGAELHRVQELVVDAPVHDVDALLAGGGAHVGDVVAADEVAALHQVDAHHAGQEGVLEVGAVVHARGEHHDARVRCPGRGGGPQGTEQVAGVVVDRRHRRGAEQVREHPGHHPAVLHHVAHARRAAEVVLQHAELAVVVADDVDAGDVDAHAAGRLHAVDLAVEVRRGVHQLAGHHLVVEHLAGAVDVGQERLEGQHPLADARLQAAPLLGGEDPGHQVEREGPLLAGEGEGDAPVPVGPAQPVGPRGQVCGALRLQRVVHGPVGVAHPTEPIEHLVVGPPDGARAVVVEQVAHLGDPAATWFRVRAHDVNGT
nr:hypothetical protein [Aquihabitans sp. G128]